MSHLLSQTPYIQQKPILNTSYRGILQPQINNLFIIEKTQQEQKLLLKELDKYTQQQLDGLHKKNILQLNRQFNKLKQNMKKKMNRKNYTVEKIFNCSKNIKTKNIFNQHDQIDLAKKYNTQLSFKIYLAKEAEEIQAKKSLYQSWRNTKDNSPTKSPNYNKMIHLLNRNSQSSQNSPRLSSCFEEVLKTPKIEQIFLIKTKKVGIYKKRSLNKMNNTRQFYIMN